MELKTKLKLSTLALSLSFPVGQAIAHGEAVDPSYSRFSGWSAGAGLGATSFMAELRSDTSIGDVNNSAENHIYKYGSMGSLFLGKSWVTADGFYYGFELGANLFAADDLTQTDTLQNRITATATGATFNTSINGTNALTSQTEVSRESIEPFLDLKLGWLLGPHTLAYLRGGINFNSPSIQTNGLYQVQVSSIRTILDDNFSDPFNVISSINVQKEKDKIGFRAGTGIEYLFSPQIGLGMNYVFTFYPHVNDNPTTSGSEVACNVTEGCVVESTNFSNNTKSSLYDQEAMVQLIYHFGA